jgi:folate-binding protein YgfZ
MADDGALQAAERGALVVPAPELGTIAVNGSERTSWINGLLTCDLAGLSPGKATYGLVLVKIGRILADAWVLPAGERLLLGVPRDRVGLLREHLEKYLMMEDASHADASAEFSWALVHGPRATELVTEVPALHGGFGGAFDITGLGGGVIAAPKERMAALLDDMTRRGPDIVTGSDADWNELRVRRGVPRFGVDFGDKNYPQEASLERIAVSFQKGCYLGQEVVCRLEMRGHVIKRIVPVRLVGDPPEAGTEVHSPEGKALGTVSSAAPEEPDGALALAMVRLDFTEPGTKLEIAGREATVVAVR